VQGASEIFKYHFYARRPHSIHCKIQDLEVEFDILNVCEFNSTRKRMSLVLRGPDGKIKLYCKGADSVILERLAPNDPFEDQTLHHLEEFASEGLRTLCYAMREISQQEYDHWSKIYDTAATTLTNRAEELDKAAEIIEKDMTLLGATAIEDKLQDGVPDTIHTLQQANIKVWVLTGDRQETAINIGYSCKLLTEEMDLLICNKDDYASTEGFLTQKLNELEHDITKSTDMAEVSPLPATYIYYACSCYT
jgi:phospholipid-transporting ATPase